MPSRNTSFLATAALFLLTGACAVESDDLVVEFRETWGCNECGSNSPSTNDFQVPELSRSGAPNADGVSLLGLRHPNGTLYEADAVDDDFVALDAMGNTVALGPDLIGWDLVVYDGVQSIDLHILDQDMEMESWAVGADPISAYALAYQDPTLPTGRANVCPSYREDPYRTTVTLIVGERYDPEAKLVIDDQPDWITLACEDEATFKMKRMNYGPNDDFDGYGNPATPGQRQATIKMITADYCGTGRSFTAQGTQIYWENAARTVPGTELPVGASLEAWWTEDGAVCLDTPRFADLADVLDECGLSPCSIAPSPDVEWLTYVP